MKVNPHWNYRPYRPFDRQAEAENPFICRLAPFMTGVEVQVMDNGCPQASHTLKVRPRGTDEPWQNTDMHGESCTIDGLSPYTEYELIAVRTDDEAAQSGMRLFRTGEYPGRVVSYLHPEDQVYRFSGSALCNPCIVKLPSGRLITCADVFEGEAPQNLEVLYRSEDGGKTWAHINDLFPCTWGTLFLHRGVLYMLATSTENGDILIGASYDEGDTWTQPTRLFPGSGTWRYAGWQRQPMPMLEYQGKLMTSIEYGSWLQGGQYAIHTLWTEAEADLLDAQSWNMSAGTNFDKAWPGAPRGGTPALLEGNLFVDREGKVLNLLRMEIKNCSPAYGYACFLQLDMDDLDAAPAFHSIREMPSGSNTKTYVQYDAVSDKYWAIGNLIKDPTKPNARNAVGLLASDDGLNWRTVKELFDFSHLDAGRVGMQYHHFIIDGENILWLSRTAFNMARNYHDANCQTFHVIENFRMMDK